MPAVAAVAIPAAASIVGGVIAHKTAANAAKTQRQTADAALGYQKSRDTIADQRYQAAWNDYQKRHAAWEARNFGGGTPAGGGGGVAVPAGNSLGAMELTGMDLGSPPAAGASPDGKSVADLGPWSDWRRYGVS